MNQTLSHALFIAKGILSTLNLLIMSIVIGTIIGILIAITYHKKYARLLSSIYISILRGTPVILQLALIYFALPTLLSISISSTSAGIICFGLNSSAYIAEILRGGIESIPKGQFEVAMALGIPSRELWQSIILPQVIINILPAFINEIITLLKETALIATIGGSDIMRLAQIVAAEQFTYFLPLCIAGAYYYILVLLISLIGTFTEKRFSYAKN